MQVVRTIPSRADQPIALTIGNFDGVHLGHQAMLAGLKVAASSLGVPACVMTFEPHPREFFAPDQAPARLTSLREKLELLASFGVDRAYVLRFNFELARIAADDFVMRVLHAGLGVRWLQVGDDFRFGARRAGDIALLKRHAPQLGFEVAGLQSVTVEGGRVSSTLVRAALADGRIEDARRLIGRPYSISGRVVAGDRIGRTLGFPTANVGMRHNRPPLSGIVAVEMRGIRALPVQGVASLGVRPTVTSRGKPTLEVHLFDFAEDIYGRRVTVDFLHKFRDEEKYADLPSLTRQIGIDVENARAYFSVRGA